MLDVVVSWSQGSLWSPTFFLFLYTFLWMRLYLPFQHRLFSLLLKARVCFPGSPPPFFFFFLNEWPLSGSLCSQPSSFSLLSDPAVPGGVAWTVGLRLHVCSCLLTLDPDTIQFWRIFFLWVLKYFLRQWSLPVLCFMLFVRICFSSFVSTQTLPQRRTGKWLKEPIDLSQRWKELDAVLLCARGCTETPASLEYL